MRATRVLLVVEILLLIATLVLAVLWIRQPEGNFEPFTVLCGALLAVLEVVRRKLDRTESHPPENNLSGSSEPSDPVEPAAIKLLDLIRQEDDEGSRGIVEICKEVEPGKTYFFPRVQYAGSPSGMASRHFRPAVEELIRRYWLSEPEYNESTDTVTYYYRSP